MPGIVTLETLNYGRRSGRGRVSWSRPVCLSSGVGDRRPLVVSAWSVLWPLIGFAVSVAAIFTLYWTIRLAVRHGVQDARRRRDLPAEDDPSWDTARF
jgi:hypothetical protein